MTVGRYYMLRKVANYTSGGVPLAEALKIAGVTLQAYEEALRIEAARPKLGSKRRASYMEAVAWIANNDEAAQMNLRVVTDSVTVLLIADIFAKDPEIVAKAVLAYRSKNQGDGT